MTEKMIVAGSTTETNVTKLIANTTTNALALHIGCIAMQIGENNKGIVK